MAEKIKEFINHLMVYGGISIDKGRIYIWGDSAIFFPMEAVVDIYDFFYSELGQNGLDLLYYFEYISGKNGILVFKHKFGINADDFEKNLAGAIIDGWGLFSIDQQTVKDDKKSFIIKGNNSSLPIALNKADKKYNTVVDYFFAGLLAGGASAVFGSPYICQEITCTHKGDPYCSFSLHPTNQEFIPELLKAKYKIYQEHLTKSYELYAQRKAHYQFLKKKNLKLEQGYFVYEGFQGIILQSYIFLLLTQLLKSIDEKKYLIFIDLLSKKMVISIKSLKKNVQGINLTEDAKILSLLGVGEFEVIRLTKEKYVLKNVNNPLAEDWRYFFGKPDDSNLQDYFIVCMLKNYFFEMYSKNIVVVEKDCKSKNAQACVFELSGF
jgi:hypothetical protein